MKKTLLITGIAGFAGHHLCEGVLQKTDWNIIGLDCLSYAGNLNRITDVEIWKREKDRVKFIWHDLKSPIFETTHKMIGNLDYIWHLAAESYIHKSLEDALPFAQSNVAGTTNLLEYIKRCQPNIKKYIGFNTDECFGGALEGIYYKETDKFYPSNPYSASKAGQWCMEFAFAHAFKLPIIMVHSMNIIGERQHPEKFIPKTVKTILNNEKVILHQTEGKFASRKWIPVQNACDGLLFLTNYKTLKGDTYNIAGEERNVYKIANFINQVIKNRDLKPNEIEIMDAHSERPGHDFRYSLSDEKIRKLGWNPAQNLEESLEKCVRWMIKKENLKWLSL